jgi:hypothetical protein
MQELYYKAYLEGFKKGQENGIQMCIDAQRGINRDMLENLKNK